MHLVEKAVPNGSDAFVEIYGEYAAELRRATTLA